jgi:hypothetical protein
VVSRSRQLLGLSFSLLVAAAVLLYRLTDFPLYFFCDEAVQSAEVRSLLDSGKDRAGAAWPLFIRGHGSYQLSLSVYWLMPFQAVLGASERVVRLSHLVASLIGVTAAAFFLRRAFAATLLWTLVPLVFYGASFWYLHSRTAFEVVISASAWLVCISVFPLLWSVGSDKPPRASGYDRRDGLAWAGFVVAFAMCFYSYTPAHGWALLTLLVLLVAWLPVTWRHWQRTLLLVGLVVLVISPFLIAAIVRPEVAFGRLRDLVPANEALVTWPRVEASLRRLVTILNPAYWFSAETRFESSERHTIPGLSLIPKYYLPFAAWGVLYCLRHFRTKPEARALLMLFPVGAFPAILVDVNPLRSMPIGLIYVLWACTGLAAAGEFVRGSMTRVSLYPIALAALVLHAAWLPFYVFSSAITRYSDYGFYGVQMGEREVFGWVRANYDRYPLIRLTHAAFNGNEALVDFYLPGIDKGRFRVRSADASCVLQTAETEVWILRRERLVELERSGCPVQVESLHTINDPRGQPLFSAVRLTPLEGFVPDPRAPQ